YNITCLVLKNADGRDEAFSVFKSHPVCAFKIGVWFLVPRCEAEVLVMRSNKGDTVIFLVGLDVVTFEAIAVDSGPELGVEDVQPHNQGIVAEVDFIKEEVFAPVLDESIIRTRGILPNGKVEGQFLSLKSEDPPPNPLLYLGYGVLASPE